MRLCATDCVIVSAALRQLKRCQQRVKRCALDVGLKAPAMAHIAWPELAADAGFVVMLLHHVLMIADVAAVIARASCFPRDCRGC